MPAVPGAREVAAARLHPLARSLDELLDHAH